MRGTAWGLVVAIVALSGYSAANAWAGNVYSVTPGTTDAAATSCSSTGATTFDCPNLRTAIAVAEHDDGSTIQLGAGTYTLTLGHLSINASGITLAIAGAGSTQTTIEQTGAERVMNLNSGTMTLSGVKVTGGSQTAVNGNCGGATAVSGGGILNSGTLTLDDVLVKGNSATGTTGADASAGTAGDGGQADGGGICSTGSLTLTNSTVSNNTVTGGSAGTGSSTASGGVGGDALGGGIEALGPLAVTTSTIGSNTVVGGNGGPATGTGDGGRGGQSYGGGLRVGGSSGSSVTGTLISGNFADGGPGGDAAAGNGGVGGSGSGSAVAFESTGAGTITGSTIFANGGFGGLGGAGSGNGNTSGSGANALGTVYVAIAAPSNALTITHSTLKNNTGTGGAPGAALSSATRHSGGAAIGGGIYVHGGGVTLTASTVSGNEVDGASSGSPSVFGGQADGGGLAAISGTSLTVVNTTIVGNIANASYITDGRGGGIEATLGSLTLANVTLTGNHATSATANGYGQGGNLYLTGAGGSANVSDTIVSAGTAGGPGSNCAGTFSIAGTHNLESTTPSQCGFSSADQDLIGVDPLLGLLADNGGATLTMALGAGSPAINAGGQCTDPANGGAALAVDQRDQPRVNACDIGAFEGQPPVATSAPALSGNPAVGSTLTCSGGTFTGAAPITTSLQWLRAGSAIAGATSSTYTVTSDDAGQQLSCSVTATNSYGQATSTSPALTVPAPAVAAPVPAVASAAPAISKLAIAPRTFAAASSGGSIARKRKTGATVSYVDSLTATTTFTVLQAKPGIKRGKSCIAPPRHPKRGSKRCTRYVSVGSFTHTDKAGANRFHFTGRVHKRRLAPGSYKLRAVPRLAGKTGVARTVAFKIKR